MAKKTGSGGDPIPRLLDSESAFQRAYGIKVVMEFEPEQQSKYVPGMLGSKYPDVASAAVKIVAEYPPEWQAKYVPGMLGSEYPDVASAAVKIVAEYPPEWQAKYVPDMLGSASQNVASSGVSIAKGSPRDYTPQYVLAMLKNQELRKKYAPLAIKLINGLHGCDGIGNDFWENAANRLSAISDSLGTQGQFLAAMDGCLMRFRPEHQLVYINNAFQSSFNDNRDLHFLVALRLIGTQPEDSWKGLANAAAKYLYETNKYHSFRNFSYPADMIQIQEILIQELFARLEALPSAISIALFPALLDRWTHASIKMLLKLKEEEQKEGWNLIYKDMRQGRIGVDYVEDYVVQAPPRFAAPFIAKMLYINSKILPKVLGLLAKVPLELQDEDMWVAAAQRASDNIKCEAFVEAINEIFARRNPYALSHPSWEPIRKQFGIATEPPPFELLQKAAGDAALTVPKRAGGQPNEPGGIPAFELDEQSLPRFYTMYYDLGSAGRKEMDDRIVSLLALLPKKEANDFVGLVASQPSHRHAWPLICNMLCFSVLFNRIDISSDMALRAAEAICNGSRICAADAPERDGALGRVIDALSASKKVDFSLLEVRLAAEKQPSPAERLMLEALSTRKALELDGRKAFRQTVQAPSDTGQRQKMPL